MAKATPLPIRTIDDLRTEATRTFYAGAGVVDLAVEAVREYVADVQKKLGELQKDAHARLEDVQKSVKDPQALRGQVETVLASRIEALTDEAKARRTAIEKRVAELQGEALALPTQVRKQLDETTATATAAYADLAQRGEVLVGRIRNQESTKAATTAATTTSAKAKTTTTQARKTAAKSTTAVKKTAKKSPAPRSAKATGTAAKKTTTAAAAATTEAAAKVGD